MRDEIFQDCLREQESGKTRFWPDLQKKWQKYYENSEALRGEFRREKKRRGMSSSNSNLARQKDPGDFVELKSNGQMISDRVIEICEADLKDERKLLIAHKFNPDEWSIVTCRNNLWNAPNKDLGKIVMYQSRLTVRPKEVKDLDVHDIEKIFSKKEFSLPILIKKSYLPSNESLEVNITDLHFGSDANHAPEKRFSSAIDDLIERVGKRIFDKVLVVMMGDIFHYDNVNRTTSAGTVVTTNGMKPYEVFDLGLTTLIENILKLSTIAPVEVIFVPGNHDPMNGYSLAKTLEAYFKNEESINFDTQHQSRKYRLIGNNLVGWMHGDMPKARAGNWLQVEASKEWGMSIYREIHAGNFHSQQVQEDGGVILRYVSGMTDMDEWHYSKGYVGAVRALNSFVWDKEKGLREQWFTTV